MTIEITTLNGFQICLDGRPAPSLTNTERALLVILAWTAGTITTRQWLIEVLWDQSTTRSRRHSLSQLLYRLSSKLPIKFRSTTSTIAVDPETFWCDAKAFISHAEAGESEPAIRLFRRPFLQDGINAPSRAFEEWCDGVKQSIERHAVRILMLAVVQAKSIGNWYSVEAMADRLISIDQFDESYHATRLSAIAASGRPDLALTAYNELVQRFKAELGTVPSHPELIGLTRLSMQPAPTMLTRFVGRESEFKEMTAQWLEVSSGYARVVAICGEAGIGKSRFAEHFLRYAAVRGARVFIGKCISQEASLPFAALGSAMRNGIRTADLRGLDPSYLQSLRPILGDSILGSPDEDRSGVADARFAGLQVADAFVRLLSALAETRPAVIFLDDAHWADDNTALILGYVRARLDAAVLIVFTCRRDDFERRSIADFVVAGPTQGPHRVLDLQPLSVKDCWDLFDSFEESTSCPVSRSLREALYGKTGGRPFFIVEALKDLRFGRRAHQFAATDCVNAELPGLPRAITDLIQSRLSRLSSQGRDVADLMAVVDNVVTARVVRGALGLDVRTIAEVVHELSLRGLVQEKGAEIQFAHGLVGEAIRNLMPSDRRRALHRRLADYLAMVPTTNPADVARHYAAAGESARAHRAQMSMADRAMHEHLYSAAEYYVREALANAPTLDDQVKAETVLLRLLVRSRRMLQATPYASSLRAKFAESADAEGVLTCDTVLLCDTLLRATMPSAAILRDALRLVVRARAADSAETLAFVMAMLAESAHDAGREEFLVNFTRGLKRRADEAGVSPASATLFALAARLGCLYTSAAKAAEYGARAVNIATQIGDAPLLVNCMIALATAQLRCGALHSARATFEAALAVTTERQVEYLQRRVANNFAVCLMELGRIPDAIALLERAMRGADGHDTLFLEGNLALVFLTTGRHEAAARIGESLLGHNQLLRMPWLQAFSESIVGFYKISVGAFHEAEALAESVHHVIGNRKYLVSDQSYIESFLAKVDAIRGERQTALQRLAAAQTALAPVNFVGSLRVGLDRIEILSILNPSSASDELLKLRVAAQRAGAFPLVERMDALRTEWGG